MKNYDPLSFATGEKQEAQITTFAPVLPLSRLSIYWFPFGIERPIQPPVDVVKFGRHGFDLKLIKALGLFV